MWLEELVSFALIVAVIAFVLLPIALGRRMFWRSSNDPITRAKQRVRESKLRVEADKLELEAVRIEKQSMRIADEMLDEELSDTQSKKDHHS